MFVIGVMIIIALFLIGMPIWLAFTVGGTFLLLFYADVSVLSIPTQFFSSLDSFTLMAIPFFLIAGSVMAHCGPSRYIFDVINSWFGRIKGGLAFTAVLMCMVYASITGSATATLAGVADIVVPHMVKAGYTKKFIAGMLACTSTLGQLIPPSCYMIIYGAIVQENTGTLFISGIIPGIICGLAMGLMAIILQPIRQSKDNMDDTIYSWGNRFTTLYRGTPALIMPLIILGGIYTGIFTPTEAGAMSVAYGVFISALIYRTLDFKITKSALSGSASAHGMIFMIIAAAMIFAQSLTYEQLPQRVSQIVLSANLDATQMLLASSLLFLVFGCFLDPLPILYLVVPVLLPALQATGVNLIHFNIVTVLCMQIAQVTPPFGLSLYVSSGLLKVPMLEVVKTALPFLAVMVAVLLLLIFVPELSLFLPSLM